MNPSSNDPLIELMSAVCDRLESNGIDYAVTGSVASSAYGDPRASIDVDIAVRMTPQQARQFVASLPPHFYRSDDAIQEAAKNSGMANVIDMTSNLKADICVLPREPFFESVLARRQKIDYGEGAPHFWTVTAEDVVLMKLLWRRESQSQKQWNDAMSVVRARGGRLEWNYLRDWATALGVSGDLQRLADAAQL